MKHALDSRGSKAKYLGVVAVLAFGVLVFTLGLHHSPVCPDDFATSEESTTAMNAWTNSYFDAHPDASMGDWARARRQFYVDNNCMAALQRVQDAETGKADPKTMEMVNGVIKDALNNSSQ